MQSFLGGQAVVATIPIVDAEGVAITATAVSYRVLDGAETELVASTTLSGFVSGNANAVVTVLAAGNTLGAGVVRDVRSIELTLTTAQGTRKLSYEYFIETAEILAEGVNSFQNYGTACLTACDIPNLTGWDAATKTERLAALLQARLNLAPLHFRYVFDSFQNIVEPAFGIGDITILTQAQYLNLPAEFKLALRRAQVLEADYLLAGDVTSDDRLAGIISKRVGESTEIYSSTKPVQSVACRRATMALAKYISNRVRIGRTGGPSTDSSPYTGMF